jgi:hypothetical protein
VLISVVGSSGLGQVAGVPVGRPASLLRVVAERPDQLVVVLAPWHAATAARRQADLVAAARPSARVEVLASQHHALTLTLVAERLLRTAQWSEGGDDVLRRAEEMLASARSLVWSPSVWWLHGGITLGQRLRCFRSAPGLFLELGQRSRLTESRQGWLPGPGGRLYGVAPSPELMAAQLGTCVLHQVDTEIEPGAPYASSATRLLTALPADSLPADSLSTDSPPVESFPPDRVAGPGPLTHDSDLPQESEAA